MYELVTSSCEIADCNQPITVKEPAVDITSTEKHEGPLAFGRSVQGFCTNMARSTEENPLPVYM